MHSPWVAVLCLAAVVRAAPGTTACVRDNCLRAVIASAFPTRSGTVDCSSYFETTVTPATSTITATAFLTATLTATNSVTISAVTTTSETDVITSITTETDTVAVTDTLAPTTTVVISPPVKRQVTVVPSSIPAYASPCSGSVRYSSACSCIGVTASTSTAPTPLTTITITNTITDTATATLIQTSSSTETDIVLTTMSTTTTTIATSTTTTTAPVCTYSLVYSNSDCAYNHYQTLKLLNTNDATQAFQDCSVICDANPTCVEISFDFVTPEGVYECSTDNVFFLGVGYTQTYYGQCYSYNKVCA